MSLFSELIRRNVFKVAVAYAAACWLLLQLAGLVLDNVAAPDWVMPLIMLAMVIGFAAAIIVAWAFEVTPDGIRLEKHVDRSQSITRYTGRQLNRGIIVILCVAVVFLLTERFRDELIVRHDHRGSEQASTQKGDAHTDVIGREKLLTGQLAEAYQRLHAAYLRNPQNVTHRTWLGLVHLHARQYEVMAGVAPDHLAVLALSRLGHTEKAFILGERAIGEGANPDFYFRALLENGRFGQLVEVLETRWPNLEAFVTDWPGNRGHGFDAMASIAYAYRSTGRQQKFEEALEYYKSALDAQHAADADSAALNYSEAVYAVMSGDRNGAIDLAVKALDQGFYIDTQIATAHPLLGTLDGNPGYEAAKNRMSKRLEMELVKMNSHPDKTD